MSENLVEARPYAKAIFALALRENKIEEWEQTLQTLALIAMECKQYYLLKNPKINKAHKMELFMRAAHDISTKLNFPAAENLLRLLILQKRMGALPQITTVYQQLVREYQNILDAKVVAAEEISIAQKESIIKSLEKRYNSKVNLHCEVDPELIGGAIIYAQDRVLDGSIRSKLRRLMENLD